MDTATYRLNRPFGPNQSTSLIDKFNSLLGHETLSVTPLLFVMHMKGLHNQVKDDVSKNLQQFNVKCEI